jgi:hypothetical protein
VAEELVFTEQEATFLKELVRNRVAFLIVGLASAALQGAPAVTQDVDLWFKNLSDPGIRKALDKVGAVYVPPMGGNPPMFAGGGAELFDIVMRMDGLESFTREYSRAIEVSLGRVKVRALPLHRIIASKRAANRSKDRLTIPMLENALLSLSATRDKRSPRKKRP